MYFQYSHLSFVQWYHSMVVVMLHLTLMTFIEE